LGNPIILHEFGAAMPEKMLSHQIHLPAQIRVSFDICLKKQFLSLGHSFSGRLVEVSKMNRRNNKLQIKLKSALIHALRLFYPKIFILSCLRLRVECMDMVEPMDVYVDQDFTCPKCGFIIKTPFTEAKIEEHMNTHPGPRFNVHMLRRVVCHRRHVIYTYVEQNC